MEALGPRTIDIAGCRDIIIHCFVDSDRLCRNISTLQNHVSDSDHLYFSESRFLHDEFITSSSTSVSL